MATKKTTKLIDVLKSNIKKSDDQKALEKAQRQVKRAAKNFNYEIGEADEAADAARDNLEEVVQNPNSSGAEILEAQRALALAEKNLEDLKAIGEERF